MKWSISVIVFFSFFSHSIFAQKVNNGFNLSCNRVTDEINIDGVLNETTWVNADVARDFHMIQPMDTALAEAKTEVRVA